MGGSTIRKARLAYFLAWVPMTALVSVILHKSSFTVVEAVVAGLILCVPYSLVCGSTYYMCKAMPLERGRVLQVLPRLVLSAEAASGIWVAVAIGIAEVVGGDLGDRLMEQVWILFGVGVVYFALSLAFHYLVLGLERVRQVEQEASEAAMLGREAELRALRAQLDPHFLFNSLNSVAALIGTDQDRARDMCRRLSGFFRETLRLGDKKSISLEEELELVRDYLAIEQVRFADRLTFTEDVDEECLRISMPPLLLQPLVENAVKHGVAHRLESTEVLLRAKQDEDRITLRVSNPYDEDSKRRRGKGRGLRIVRERLSSFYGSRARMVLDKTEGEFTVEMYLPREKRSR